MNEYNAPMEIYSNLESLPENLACILTLGNFDGVHLGHKYILERAKDRARQMKLPVGVITFENHPSSVLRPNHPVLLLSSQLHKLALLKEQNVDFVLSLPFTEELSKMSAEAFLGSLHEKLPFRTLILGFNALLGNDRLGNVPELLRIGQKHHFTVEYLDPYLIDNEPVSSTKIRSLVQTDDLERAEKLLGRKFSVYGPILNDTMQETITGCKTAHIDMKGHLCPPYGVYAITAVTESFTSKGIANLGLAPTFRHDHHPLLEVHLFHEPVQLKGQWVEVIFDVFLRPEQVFHDLEALKEQIAKDIAQAKAL